jgi:nucleoid-associated protein YgaU
MSDSHDPVKDAVKHLFGLDKKEASEPAEQAQPIEQAQPAEQPAAQPQPQETQASAPDWSQIMGAAGNLANQAVQQMPTPQPSPTVGNPFGDNPQAVASNPPEEARQAVESQAQAHEDVPAQASAPVAPNPDVESINGHAVGYAFLRYYKAHPEIGQPVDEQHGNVGGYQMFEHAILHWDGSNVQVENRGAQGQGGGQRTYTVNSGDNLSAIAQNFYGDASQWHRIYDANRDKISNPDLIHPGQELVIP